MSTVFIVLLVLALILGGVGLFVEALWWLLIIAAVLFVVSLVSGMFRGGPGAGPGGTRGPPRI